MMMWLRLFFHMFIICQEERVYSTPSHSSKPVQPAKITIPYRPASILSANLTSSLITIPDITMRANAMEILSFFR